MDILLVLIWFLMALGFLFSLIGSLYFLYVHGAKSIDILAKSTVALIVYGFMTLGTGFPAGFILFIGAHSSPPGSILGTREWILGAILLFAYLALGWLTCSFIVGGLIWPSWMSERFNSE